MNCLQLTRFCKLFAEHGLGGAEGLHATVVRRNRHSNGVFRQGSSRLHCGRSHNCGDGVLVLGIPRRLRGGQWCALLRAGRGLG